MLRAVPLPSPYPWHVHNTSCLSIPPCLAQLFGKGDSWADTLDREVAKRNTLLLVALSPVAPREPTANSSSSAGWDGHAYEPQPEQQQQQQQDKQDQLQQVGCGWRGCADRCIPGMAQEHEPSLTGYKTRLARRNL